MVVYVINQHGKKLMPCKPARARHLLKAGVAKVIKRSPFTIQLLTGSKCYIQPVIVGIDKGSKYTGISCIGNKRILFSGIINHRTDITKKMEARANNRRQRRNRLWYRKPRFNNRGGSKRIDRLPPSIKANVEEVYRVLRKIPLPINKVIIEDVQVDIAKLNDNNLKGEDYQKSNKLDENLRMACLIRDNFTCQVCKAKNVKLEAHHIIYRSKGGKDTIKNLITLCEKCHKKVHKGVIKLNIKGIDGFKDRIAQRTMQGKTHLYQLLKDEFINLSTVFGYETAYYRKSLGLYKDHDTDALCISTLLTKEKVPYNRNNFYNINFKARQTRRQYYDKPKKGIGRAKYQINKQSSGFRKGDLVLVKGFLKQINSIYSNGILAFKRVKGEPSSATPKKCKLIEYNPTITFIKT